MAQESVDWPAYFQQRSISSADNDLLAFYAAGIPAADTPLSEVDFVALDFETTGMNPQHDAIVSIGAVPFTLSRIRPSAGGYWVVKPPAGMSDISISIHRITHSEIEHAPELDSILGELLQMLKGKVVVVHYEHIERPFLDRSIRTLRGESFLFPVIDTMAIEISKVRQGVWAHLKHLLGIAPVSVRLTQSRERYSLPAYTAHHAKVDAMATAELFQAQVLRHFSHDKPVGELWV